MGGIDFNGVNGNSPLEKFFGTKKTEGTTNTFVNSGFEIKTEGVGDITNFSSKPAFNNYYLEQMWAMAGITKPNSVKPLENTMAFAAEMADAGVELSEEDMNLAGFMFNYMQS